MPRPDVPQHLRRLLQTEKTYIMSLFEVNQGSGKFYCALKAPVTESYCALEHGGCYAYAEAHDPVDAIMAAREKLWGTL